MATIIDLDKAKSLIQEYREQNAADGGPGLVTPDKKLHNGFFISRESLEDALSNPKAVGVSINFAKHPDFTGTNDKVFTLVFAGAEDAPAGSATTHINTGHVYAAGPPCPSLCGNL